MMFWGCFNYDYKGPWYCWKEEITQENKVANQALEKINEELELLMKEK